MAWRTKTLHLGTLASLILLEIGTLVTLIVLQVLSEKNQGFVAIKEYVAVSASANGYNLDSTWNVGFLWTSVPSLFMGLFGLAWSAVVDSLAEETPMRDLVDNGGQMKHTLLLDYRRHMALIRWFYAFKNKHIFLGICMLLTTINTIILLPLASHLFTPAPVDLDKLGTFAIQTSYNASSSIASIDYATTFSTVTAVRLHGGIWPTYTDGSYVYPTFIVPTTANLTHSSVNITGYGASLDCVQLGVYNISRLDDNQGSATISLSATDRGCSISFKGGVGSGSTTFLKTQSTLDCPQESGSSRISYFVGSYAPSAPYLLDNLSVVSCKPSYNQTVGILTAPPSLAPLSFQPSGQSSDARIVNWRGYEQTMLSLSNIGNSDSADFTSAFGELILGIARQRSPTSPLSPSVLIASTKEAFANVFVVFAKEHLFSPLATAQAVSGILTVSETRLTVVTWSTYTSVAIIAVLVGLTIYMIFYLWKNKPLLPEEPRGVAGYASLMYGSGAYNGLLRDANRSDGYTGKFYDWLKSSYVLGNELCTLDQRTRVIDIQGLVAIPRPANGNAAGETGPLLPGPQMAET